MKTVIVFNHPYEGSFCTAILASVTAGLKKAGHEVDLMHLDRDRFNPVMSAEDLRAFVNRKPVDPQVITYQSRLESADHLIFIFPIWWELMPAMMKGFIDKVIFPGVAYEYKPNGFMQKKLVNIKGITLITTMNTPGLIYRLFFGNAIKKALFNGTFWKTGYQNRKWISLNMVKSVSPGKRRKWLSDLEKKFEKLR